MLSMHVKWCFEAMFYKYPGYYNKFIGRAILNTFAFGVCNLPHEGQMELSDKKALSDELEMNKTYSL